VVKLLSLPLGSSRVHGFSLAEYRYFSDRTKSFAGLIAMNERPVRLGFEGFGKASFVEFVSGNYFHVLGVTMERGRGFLPEEDRLDTPENVVVLSYPIWRDHFGSDPTILGKQVYLAEIRTLWSASRRRVSRELPGAARMCMLRCQACNRFACKETRGTSCAALIIVAFRSPAVWLQVSRRRRLKRSSWS
jgi:hypothetical protein